MGIMMGIEKTGKCDLKGVYLANKIRMSRKVVGESASDNPEGNIGYNQYTVS